MDPQGSELRHTRGQAQRAGTAARHHPRGPQEYTMLRPRRTRRRRRVRCPIDRRVRRSRRRQVRPTDGCRDARCALRHPGRRFESRIGRRKGAGRRRGAAEQDVGRGDRRGDHARDRRGDGCGRVGVHYRGWGERVGRAGGRHRHRGARAW